MVFWLVIICLCGLIAFSLWLRICHSRSTLDLDNVETKPSPFSLAVQDLVATAGGVYLSLIMLTSFLKLNIPERLNLMNIYFDPLALLSLGVAVMQPIVLRLVNLIHNK